ncbi:tetratricopeptide repeat protein [Lacinutrix mariniflava]|uniref:tetratricopeptide repeat protein n=1 Tax=Lacinutrix mariniflava TaxID=342955 RepID=UPI0006E2B612|nr:tetratricopeptide repeat protein [Lacinutrix mariniflava]
MEKLLKSYLSLCCLLVLFSCKNETSLNASEKRESAEKTYKAAIQFRQGSTAFQNGIAEAVTIDPTYEPGVYELSVADLKRGLPHKWLPQYNKAVKMDSVTRIPWRGYLYLWFYRDYKKAIADFDASDTLTPDFIDAPQGHSVDYWRGIAYLGLNDYKNSNAYFEKHITKETKEFGEDYVDITAFLYNGISYFEAGDYEKALLNFNKQLEYSRNLSADAKYYKAQIFIAEDKNKEALETINEAIDDYNQGYNNKRAYVETLRQIYPQDLTVLKSKIEKL